MERMSKEWTVEAEFNVITSVICNNEKEAKGEAKKALHELASFIRPYCDCLDITLKNVDCYEEDNDDKT